MSMMGTLAKIAVGVAVAKGMKSLTTGGGSPRSTGGGGMLGDLLKNVAGGQTAGRTGGGGDILGDLLGGLAGGGAGGAARGPGASLGLDNIMDGLTKGGGGAAGGLGDMLGKLGGGGAAGGLGGLLTNALENRGQVTQQANAQEEAAAELLIRAMLQAAKADGEIDAAEKQKLLERLGELDQQEVAFVNRELGKGIDLEGLARETPRGMEAQVYMMSLMGIDLDSQQEAQYLHDLGGALGMDRNQINQVHQMMGVQSLYG